MRLPRAFFSLSVNPLLSAGAQRKVRERLIVFTRYPEPGRTKTRLIPVLGRQGAADLQRRMTLRTLTSAERLRRCRPTSLEVRFEGGSKALMEQCFGSGFNYRAQGHGDLGERMLRALDDALRAKMDAVVVVGTDCPGLSADLFSAAFAVLKDTDVVLGPANDGGYYLIGLRRVVPELFAAIPWGTDLVFQTTMRACERLGLSISLLGPLDDVDRPKDLTVWERATGCSARTSPVERVSVIIPTLNEAANLGAALASARSGTDLEVIVADGGSTDNTVEVARSHGALVLNCLAGRASQMNAAAAMASGDVLLFLHADTRLPNGFDSYIRWALKSPEVAGGAFELRTEVGSSGLRFIVGLVNWRSRWLQMPFGDQALFVRRALFRKMGGFPDMPIMEDYEFVRRLKRQGRVVIVPLPAVTSARRWLTIGIWRTTLINQLAIVAYRLGVSPSRIARWYTRRIGELQDE